MQNGQASPTVNCSPTELKVLHLVGYKAYLLTLLTYLFLVGYEAYLLTYLLTLITYFLVGYETYLL